jgi:DNA-binding PadR family transcriptional regulator
MSVRLVILGLLRKGPLHGYEIKHVIEQDMGDWLNIPFGSIYFALGKLRDEGSIREEQAERAGKRPEKTVYALTVPGEAEFLRLLRETLGGEDRPRFELDQALAFSEAIPRDELAQYFRRRVAALETALGTIADHERAQLGAAEVPRVARAIFSHGRFHLEAELAWARETLSAIESGSLT